MPFLYIRTCNSEFSARDDGADYESSEAALAHGIQSAIEIITDEVQRGGRTAAVDLSIEDQNGQAMLRSVVAISIAPMMIELPAQQLLDGSAGPAND